MIFKIVPIKEGDAYGLRWNDGVGTLPGSTLKFRLNEFSILEVIRDAGDNGASESITSRGSSKPTRSSVIQMGRSASVKSGTSSMNPKSPVSSAARWVKGVQLCRLQLNDDKTMAHTGQIPAHQSLSFEALRFLNQSTAKLNPPNTAPQCSVRPQKHKPQTSANAHTFRNSLHSASSVARGQNFNICDLSGQNGEVMSTSSNAYPLLPGANALTGGRFLSAQSIFDLLSQPTVRERALRAVPTGPKVNCYFVVNIGAELTDYKTYKTVENLRTIRHKLRDGTGDWYYRKVENRECYTVSDTGFLKLVSLRADKNAPFDLRIHRVNYRDSGQIDGHQFAERCDCWFFNAKLSPAPGFAVVMFIGPCISRFRTAQVLTARPSSINKKKVASCSGNVDKEANESDESPPASKRRRISENTDLKTKLQVARSAESNNNQKSRTTTNEAFESDSEFICTFAEHIEDLSRSHPNEREHTSPVGSESLATGNRPRGLSGTDSDVRPTASPATGKGTHNYSTIRSAQSNPIRPPGGRPLRTVPQSPLAAKRITRLALAQNHFYAQNSSLEATRTPKAEKKDAADHMLLSLGLKKVAPASSKPSGSQLSLRSTQLRALAYDTFFASVPDPSSVSLLHSLLPLDVHQSTPGLVAISKSATSKSKESQFSAPENNNSRVPGINELMARESSLRSILADATEVHQWSATRVSALVTDVLHDVGTDEATIAAVRVGFAREPIDGVALTRFGQQELSQRFGPPFGLALRLFFSLLSRCSQSVPSLDGDTTACGEAEAVSTSTAIFDADVKFAPQVDVADLNIVSDHVPLVSFSMR